MKRIVVSLPGGGIRGVVQTVVLDELERRIGRPLAKFSDLVVGNSTGGILAGLLTLTQNGETPLYSAANAKEFYIREGPQIFSRHWYDVSTLLKVKYTGEYLEKALKLYMGGAMLSDALTKTMICYSDWKTFSLGLFKSHKTRPLSSVIETFDVPVWYAAYCTAAASTYFPPKDDRADGGLVSTNPGMYALTEAKKLWPIDDIHLITIGTGRHQREYTTVGHENDGAAKLVSHVIDFTLDGPANEVSHMVEVWNPGRNYTIQGDIDTELVDPGMDAASPDNITQLIAFAYRTIHAQELEMDRIVALCK